MNLETTTPPSTFPVTLADAWLHLRLDPDDSPPTHPDDAMLLRHIASATGDAEKFTRRAFVRQGVTLFTSGCGRIELLRPPLIRVTSVKYYDGDNALQTVDPSSYYVTNDLVPRLQFGSSYAWPTVYGRDDAVRVDYVVGYDATDSPDDAAALRANVPSQIKDAILLGVQLLYDQLSPEQRQQVERARESLLIPFRIPFSV